MQRSRTKMVTLEYYHSRGREDEKNNHKDLWEARRMANVSQQSQEFQPRGCQDRVYVLGTTMKEALWDGKNPLDLAVRWVRKT